MMKEQVSSSWQWTPATWQLGQYSLKKMKMDRIGLSGMNSCVLRSGIKLLSNKIGIMWSGKDSQEIPGSIVGATF